MKILITTKGALLRNLAAALVNGAITLTILLIAPLGLLAVITNTVLIMISTFVVNSFGDRVVQWVLKPETMGAQIGYGEQTAVNRENLLPGQGLPQSRDQGPRNY
jgi:hypothetical protein